MRMCTIHLLDIDNHRVFTQQSEGCRNLTHDSCVSHQHKEYSTFPELSLQNAKTQQRTNVWCETGTPLICRVGIWCVNLCTVRPVFSATRLLSTSSWYSSVVGSATLPSFPMPRPQRYVQIQDCALNPPRLRLHDEADHD